MVTTVILCGGSGTRLWPLSREAFPKQFLQLTQAGSLLEETVARVDHPDLDGPLFAVSNEAQRFLVAATLQGATKRPSRVILEPAARNTAPAIALAAMEALAADPEAIMLVLPADHVIADTAGFQSRVLAALPLAQEGKLVTFGIVPQSAHTGYGYIRANSQDGQPAAVEAFVEKPDGKTAGEYLASGDYFWNSGMFLFRADRYLSELGQFRADILSACERSWQERSTDLDFVRVGTEAFLSCPEDSIDYAVMEQTRDAVMMPLDAGWSDIGSWSALWEVLPHDDAGNATRGDVILEDVSGSYIHSEGRLVAALGLRDYVVVDTDDAVMVAPKDRVQEVKTLVAKIREQGREEHRFHRKVHRPWGTYEGISRDSRFQVKRILVNPGSKLSLQKHHHRAEHWIVVQGTGLVTRGSEQMLLSEDQSTYIPLGEVHRLENPGVIPLEIIEVQTGSYLGEDDIVRFEDTYGRS